MKVFVEPDVKKVNLEVEPIMDGENDSWGGTSGNTVLPGI